MTLSLNIRKLLPLLSLIFLFGCKKDPPKLNETDDKIYRTYQSELSELEKKKNVLALQGKGIDEKTDALTMSPKILDILRKQRQAINQNVIYLEQGINYLKIKSLSRKKYLLDNQGLLSKDDLDKQYSDFLLDREANPPKRPWEDEKLAPMLPPPPKPAEENKGGH
ncbi:MAG: hypothetical protein K2Q26_01570 [Bdellovibrionales bacterium]|nr:hypothetical protein [Bdellovibrionales bacterium]